MRRSLLCPFYDQILPHPSGLALNASKCYLIIAIVLLLLLVVLLVFLLAALDFLVSLGQGSESFALEIFQVLQSLPNLLFFEDALNQFLVVFGRAEPGKYLHHVVDLFLFFGPGLVESALLLQVQQLPANDKFLPSDPLC